MRTPVAVPHHYQPAPVELAALDDDALWARALTPSAPSTLMVLSGLFALFAIVGWPLVWGLMLDAIGGGGLLFGGIVASFVTSWAFGRAASAVTAARVVPTLAPRRMLAQRYGQLPFGEEIAAARVVCAEGGAAAIAIVRALSRPHGDMITARVELGADGAVRASRVQGRPLLFVGERPTPGERYQTIATPDDAVTCARLLEVVRELGAGPSHVTDGLYVDVAVVRRGADPLVGSCNLAGLPDEDKRHPTVRVAELVLRMSAPPLPGQ